MTGQSLHSRSGNSAKPSATAESHHCLSSVKHKTTSVSFRPGGIRPCDAQMGGLCLLPLRGCGWWNAGPFCWWQHLCEDVRPLCPDNPKRPLSEPFPSAYYWTGEPTKRKQDFIWVFKWCNWTNCNQLQSLSHSTSEISIWNSPAVFPKGLAAALQPANPVYSPWTVDPEQSSQRVACSRPHLAYYHTLKKKKRQLKQSQLFFFISLWKILLCSYYQSICCLKLQ